MSLLRIEFNQTNESASIYFGQKDRDGNSTIWVTRKELLEAAKLPRNEISEKLVVKLIKESKVPKCITPKYKERDAVMSYFTTSNKHKLFAVYHIQNHYFKKLIKQLISEYNSSPLVTEEYCDQLNKY